MFIGKGVLTRRVSEAFLIVMDPGGYVGEKPTLLSGWVILVSIHFDSSNYRAFYWQLARAFVRLATLETVLPLIFIILNAGVMLQHKTLLNRSMGKDFCRRSGRDITFLTGLYICICYRMFRWFDHES